MGIAHGKGVVRFYVAAYMRTLMERLRNPRHCGGYSDRLLRCAGRQCAWKPTTTTSSGVAPELPDHQRTECGVRNGEEGILDTSLQ